MDYELSGHGFRFQYGSCACHSFYFSIVKVTFMYVNTIISSASALFVRLGFNLCRLLRVDRLFKIVIILNGIAQGCING